jgi:hypothetical protein
MDLDILAGIFTGWVAFCIFGLHVVSSPRHNQWMSIPECVRVGLLITGTTFVWRSVNFFSIASTNADTGKINAEGMLALISIAYLCTASTWAVVSYHMPSAAWTKLSMFIRQARRGEVPAVMTTSEVAELAKSRGFVAVDPNAGPESLLQQGLPASYKAKGRYHA